MSDNPRFKKKCSRREHPVGQPGTDGCRDYTEAMNGLRDKAAVQQGSLRELLGGSESNLPTSNVIP